MKLMHEQQFQIKAKLLKGALQSLKLQIKIEIIIKIQIKGKILSITRLHTYAHTQYTSSSIFLQKSKIFCCFLL